MQISLPVVLRCYRRWSLVSALLKSFFAGDFACCITRQPASVRLYTEIHDWLSCTAMLPASNTNMNVSINEYGRFSVLKARLKIW